MDILKPIVHSVIISPNHLITRSLPGLLDNTIGVPSNTNLWKRTSQPLENYEVGMFITVLCVCVCGVNSTKPIHPAPAESDFLCYKTHSIHGHS